MKKQLTILLLVWIGTFLSGCIGESYDFSPPSVSLWNDEYPVPEVELKEANINWSSDQDYRNEIKDVESFVQKQPLLFYPQGAHVEVVFDQEDFDLIEMTVSLWKGEQKTELPIKEDRSFYLPTEPGIYVLEVFLRTGSGTAQYVGHVKIQ